MATLTDLLTDLRLRGVLRAESYIATIPAADLVGGTLTPHRVILWPDQMRVSTDVLIVTRIQTQGIKPSSLQIVASDVNRGPFALYLTPDLVVDDIPLFGFGDAGVQLDFRNAAGKALSVLIHAAIVNHETADKLLGGLR